MALTGPIVLWRGAGYRWGVSADPVGEVQELSRHSSLDDRFDSAVRIVDYDPEWPVAAAAELRRIREQLGAIAARAEHVGSTSVPGLAAKPILDLQLSVRDIKRRDTYVAPLTALGYLFVLDPTSPEYHYFAKPPERPRRYHLHVCAAITSSGIWPFVTSCGLIGTRPPAMRPSNVRSSLARRRIVLPISQARLLTWSPSKSKR